MFCHFDGSIAPGKQKVENINLVCVELNKVQDTLLGLIAKVDRLNPTEVDELSIENMRAEVKAQVTDTLNKVDVAKSLLKKCKAQIDSK